MPCAETWPAPANPRRQAGTVVLLASAFIFLLSYIALSAVDLAAVEARLADSLRQQATARSLMTGAARLAVAREKSRLQEALAQGDLQVCEAAGFCEPASQALVPGDAGAHRVAYRTWLAGPGSSHVPRRPVQASASSHLQYHSGDFEVDISVVRRSDSATLARAAVGLRVSALRGE